MNEINKARPKLIGHVPPLTVSQTEEIIKKLKTFNLRANTLYAVPFCVFDETIFDAIAIYVSKAVNGGKARLGVFQNLAENVYPGLLIADFGEVDVSADGEKAVDIQQTFTKGLIWLAVVANAAVPIEGSVFEEALSFSVDFPYAPLPEIFPSGAKERKGSTPAFFTHTV
jgi:hypothetical protein